MFEGNSEENGWPPLTPPKEGNSLSVGMEFKRQIIFSNFQHKKEDMFGIENSKDRLQQLKENFDKLLHNPLNVSLAEKTCSDAWHLIDWVFIEQKSIHH